MTNEDIIEGLKALRTIHNGNYAPQVDEAIKRLSAEPCEDCISRAELLKAIDTWDKFGCDANNRLVRIKDYYVPYIHYDDVVKAIKGMPSIQPKTGHWIEITEGTHTHWECSNCGSKMSGWGAFKHCPDCGTKMDGIEECAKKLDLIME